MDIANAHKRLKGLWGKIDRQHNNQIARYIPPQSQVLDVGCGYGSLVHQLNQQGIQALGIDTNAEHIEIGHQLFPNVNTRTVNAEFMDDMPEHSYDVIILKDTLHHLVWENDTAAAFANFRRLLKPNGKLIVYDPNPMWILKLARKIAKHIDPEVSPTLARETLNTYGFAIQRETYYEVCGLPLSGGYVGVQLVPNIAVLNNLVAATNDGLSTLFTA